MKKMFTYFTVLCLFGIQSMSAQMLVGTDVLSFDFYGYDLNDETYRDFRITQTGFAFDVYHSITQGDDENIAYVSLIKYNSFGSDEPWIIKYDFTAGTYQTIVLSGIEEAVSLDVDKINNKLYWIDVDLEQMMRANLDGSGVEILGEVSTFLTGWDPVLSVDEVNSKIYFTNGGGTVMVTDIDTWNPEDITSDFVEPGGRIGGVEVDDSGTYLYWSYNLSISPSYIVKTTLASGAEEKILEGVTDEAFIATYLYEDRIYWTGNLSVVHSANLDGTDSQFLFDAEPYVGDFIMRSSLPVSTHFVQDEEEQITIFPNPVHSSIGLDFGTEIVQELTGSIQIVNSIGKVVREEENNNFTNTIDVSDLTAGLYYIFFQKENGQKLVKKFSKI